MNPTLVLNADAQPLSVMPLTTLSWEDAITQWYKGDVEILEYYDDWEVHSPSITVTLPAVVMLREYKPITRNVKFSRYNVFLRDDFICQYCGFDANHDHSLLTFDHVVPRKLGGKTSWNNVVASCESCNLKKGHKTLKESGYKLNKTIRKPEYYELVRKIKNMPVKIPHKSWINYLDWDSDRIILSENSNRSLRQARS